MKKLVILDGSGYMYRSFYALSQLNIGNGQNLNAVFGFFRMVLKLFQQKPDYFVIARDSPSKTLRHQKFEQYKAQRPAIPDEFKSQIGIIKDIVKELKLGFFEIPGYEADDIIYTLTKNFEKNDFLEIYIESLDKDLKQMISKNVFFQDSSKMEVTTTDKFIQEFGFEPKCILDYLALLGDASDNIPGVKGIGKKTAQDLICQYCTIDGIYDNIDKVSPSIKEKLIQDKGLLYDNLELIRLYDAEELKDKQLEDLTLKIDYEIYKDIFIDRFGFKSYEKILDNLKKHYQSGNQLSLF